MSDIMQGLNISIAGLLITFIALGIFILIMIGLQRIFPAHKAESQEGEVVEMISSEPPSAEELAPESVAAIAVAICSAGQANTSSLGARFLEGRGRWWSAHQTVARQPHHMRRD